MKKVYNALKNYAWIGYAGGVFTMLSGFGLGTWQYWVFVIPVIVLQLWSESPDK